MMIGNETNHDVTTHPPHFTHSSHFPHSRSVAGFAIVETLVALVILSVTLVALMTMVQFARARAVVNYHDRYVLLKVDGELQKIRERYQIDEKSLAFLSPVTFRIPEMSAPAGSRPINVTVSFRVNLRQDPTIQTATVRYYEVTATAEWQEHAPFFAKKPIRRERRNIQMVEQYFIGAGE